MVYWFNVRRAVESSSMKTTCSFLTREGAEKVCLEKGIPVDVINENDEQEWLSLSDKAACYEYVDLCGAA